MAAQSQLYTSSFSIDHEIKNLDKRFDRILYLLRDDINDMKKCLIQYPLGKPETKKIKYCIQQLLKKENFIANRLVQFHSALDQLPLSHSASTLPYASLKLLSKHREYFTEIINPSSIRLQARVHALRLKLQNKEDLPI